MTLCRVSGLRGYIETSGAIHPNNTALYLRRPDSSDTRLWESQVSKNEDSITDKTN